MEGKCKCVVIVRLLCPRTRLSALGRVEDGSFWPRCFSPNSEGLINCLACTDSDLGVSPHSCLAAMAFPAVSEGVDVVWSESPCTGCAFSRSARAWLCLHTSMAFGASASQRQHVK